MRTALFRLAASLFLFASACKSDSPTKATPRPESWAEPLTRAGLPNLHRVDRALYRGAQPTAEGFKSLVDLGVKTVVSLRMTHSDAELIGDLPLRYVSIPVEAWDADSDEVLTFMRTVTDPAQQPVFVHCLHGADRTGMMSAIYRVVVQGWTKQAAIDEMKNGGFGHHSIFINLVGYVDKLDVAALKAKLKAP